MSLNKFKLKVDAYFQSASAGGRVSCQWSHDPENVGLNSCVGLLPAAEALPFAVQTPHLSHHDLRGLGGLCSAHHVR